MAVSILWDFLPVGIESALFLLGFGGGFEVLSVLYCRGERWSLTGKRNLCPITFVGVCLFLLNFILICACGFLGYSICLYC